MPMNQADIQQINDAIKGGNINAAKRLLRESDDPRAAPMLAKLDKKYPTQYTGTLPPPTSTAFPSKPVVAKPAPAVPPAKLKRVTVDDMPSPGHEMDEIKLAIREKRYDDAEALLILSHDPEAEVLRQRLSDIRGGGGSSREKVKREESLPDMSAKLTITIFLLLFLTLFGLIALAIWLPEARRYPDAPGAKGLILTNTVVTWILRGILALLLFFLLMMFISYLVR